MSVGPSDLLIFKSIFLSMVVGTGFLGLFQNPVDWYSQLDCFQICKYIFHLFYTSEPAIIFFPLTFILKFFFTDFTFGVFFPVGVHIRFLRNLFATVEAYTIAFLDDFMAESSRGPLALIFLEVITGFISCA